MKAMINFVRGVWTKGRHLINHYWVWSGTFLCALYVGLLALYSETVWNWLSNTNAPAWVQAVGPQGLRHMVQPLDVLGVVQVADAQPLFDALDSRIGQHRRMRLFVDRVVDVLPQARNDCVDLLVEVSGLLGGTA